MDDIINISVHQDAVIRSTLVRVSSGSTLIPIVSQFTSVKLLRKAPWTVGTQSTIMISDDDRSAATRLAQN